MKKTILIHSIVFSPDGVSTAYLYNDIAVRFKQENYDVVVLTTTPHYNVLPSALEKQPLIRKMLGLYYVSEFKGIRVIHISQKKFKSSVLRILGFAYWHVLSLFIGLFQSKIDLILSPSPPLTIGMVNLIIGKLKGAKVIYNVQEIYPDFLINQGKLNIKPLVSGLRWMEKYVYNHSDAVTTIDNVFYDTIKVRFKDKNKLKIIPNFVDTSLYRPYNINEIELDPLLFPTCNQSLKIMYAGNIGHAQDWEPVLQVAKILINKHVEFWIIGEGVMKSYLEEQIAANDLTNIHLVPYQSRESMPDLIAYADLHFIFMAPEMEGQGFPSKVYTIMACAKPLMVISGKGTPIFKFLEQLGCSYLISKTDIKAKIEGIISVIDKLLLDKSELSIMGDKGYKCIEETYSKDVVTEQYVKLGDQLISKF